MSTCSIAPEDATIVVSGGLQTTIVMLVALLNNTLLAALLLPWCHFWIWLACFEPFSLWVAFGHSTDAALVGWGGSPAHNLRKIPVLWTYRTIGLRRLPPRFFSRRNQGILMSPLEILSSLPTSMAPHLKQVLLLMLENQLKTHDDMILTSEEEDTFLPFGSPVSWDMDTKQSRNIEVNGKHWSQWQGLTISRATNLLHEQLPIWMQNGADGACRYCTHSIRLHCKPSPLTWFLLENKPPSL